MITENTDKLISEEVNKDNNAVRESSKLDIISVIHKNQSLILKIGITLFFLSLFLFVRLIFDKSFYVYGGSIKPEIASELGSSLSGISGVLFTASSVTFLILTFTSQIRNTKVNQIENIFVKMIEFHRDNINNLVLSDVEHSNPLSKQAAIYFFNMQFEEILGKIIEMKYFENEKDAIETANYVFFFGTNRFKDKNPEREYSETFVEELKNNLCFRKGLNGCLRNIDSPTELYLGHYFRNLYKAIKYIDDNEVLTSDEKKEFVNLYTSQLSSYEKTLIFLNSLSGLGHNWIKNSYLKKYEIIHHANTDLIDKYEYLKKSFDELK